MKRSLPVDDGGDGPPDLTLLPIERCEKTADLVAAGPRGSGRLSDRTTAGLADRDTHTFALYEGVPGRGLRAMRCR